MKSKILNLVVCFIIFAGCSKELLVDDPVFDVSVESTTVQAGQEIYFSFSGQVDNIWFYSGELNNDYDFKGGRIIDVSGENAIVSFKSAVTGGTQQNQLSVLYSTNFNGNYNDLGNVKSATWNDITSNFTLGTSSSFKVSGDFDITNLAAGGDSPIYFAFKYVNRPQVVNGLARTWMVENFTVTSKKQYNSANLIIRNQLFASFQIVDQNPENAPARSVITNTRISLLGNIYKDPNDPVYDPKNPIYDPKSEQYNPLAVYVPYDYNSPYNDPLSENWAVSGPIYIKTVDLGPDLSIAIKSNETKSKGYAYTYTKPGTYQAYFVATNSSVDEVKQIIKKIEITVSE